MNPMISLTHRQAGKECGTERVLRLLLGADMRETVGAVHGLRRQVQVRAEWRYFSLDCEVSFLKQDCACCGNSKIIRPHHFQA